MKKWKSFRRKQNNRGMTLVEVMVAITILAVVSTAFVKSFTLSAMVNRDSRIKQDALVVAEGLMESFKGYDLESIQEQFSGTTPNANFKFYPLSGSGTKSIVTDFSHYQLSNVDAGNGPYNVDIMVTGSGSPKSSVVTKADMNEVAVCDMEVDACFTQLDEQMAIKQYVYDTLCGLPGVDVSAVGFPSGPSAIATDKLSILERQLIVDILSDREVNVVSNYKISINGYNYTKQDGSSASLTRQVTLTIDENYDGFDTYKCFDHRSSGEALRDVYVCYYPAYSYANGCVACQHGAEKVVIRNSSGADRNVYLVKQNNSAYYDQASLVIAEGSYQANVLIQNAGGTNINLYHNLNVNLAGASITNYTLAGAGFTDKEALWDKEVDKALVYDVRIEISSARSGETLLTLNGSTNTK